MRQKLSQESQNRYNAMSSFSGVCCVPDLTKTKRLEELKSRFNAGARFTVSKMMREFGITRRTANRDLQELQELGVALEFEDLPEQRDLETGID
jgi:hypothetical protein